MRELHRRERLASAEGRTLSLTCDGCQTNVVAGTEVEPAGIGRSNDQAAVVGHYRIKAGRFICIAHGFILAR